MRGKRSVGIERNRSSRLIDCDSKERRISIKSKQMQESPSLPYD